MGELTAVDGCAAVGEATGAVGVAKASVGGTAVGVQAAVRDGNGESGVKTGTETAKASLAGDAVSMHALNPSAQKSHNAQKKRIIFAAAIRF
jgi:hypothetical protein